MKGCKFGVVLIRTACLHNTEKRWNGLRDYSTDLRLQMSSKTICARLKTLKYNNVCLPNNLQFVGVHLLFLAQSHTHKSGGIEAGSTLLRTFFRLYEEQGYCYSYLESHTCYQVWDSRSEYHLCCNKGEWGDWLLSGSHGSVVSALTFQSLILSSIPGQKPVFLIPSYLLSACVSLPSIFTSIARIFTTVCN